MSFEKALSGELSVKESFFIIARAICEIELGVSRDDNVDYCLEWSSGDHFPVPMNLDFVRLKPFQRGGLQTYQAIFELPDREMSIMVDRKSYGLEDDPFALEILERFRQYPLHEHELCLQAISNHTSEPETTALVTLRNPTTGAVVLN